jgi:hypothetical protein
MATVQELQDWHEEILERVGHLVALYKEIDGGEPEALKAKMIQHCMKGRQSLLAACGVIDEMIALRREEEGSAETP